MPSHNDKKADNPSEEPLRFSQLLQSVLAAAFGVQSGKNRSRDFSRGKPSQFIAIGLLFTVFFVLLLFGIAKLVLRLSGV